MFGRSREATITFNTRAGTYLLRLSVLGLVLLWSIYGSSPVVSAAIAQTHTTAPLEQEVRAAETAIREVRERRTERETRIPTLIAHYDALHRTRVINGQSLEGIQKSGKVIAADLGEMRLHLYQDGILQKSFDIVSKGKQGSRWETPTGLYAIQTKEKTHFSSIGEVHMPYSMQFFGNFFIHGWPYYPDGTPVDRGFSGGCIRMETVDAEKVFAFAERETPLFVYDEPVPTTQPLVSIDHDAPEPIISAKSALIADVGNGTVYFEKAAQEQLPIASISKLMTALVANETIHYGKILALSMGDKQGEGDFGSLSPTARFSVGDAFFPLLMESNNAVAHALARHYETSKFIAWMNTKARALGAEHTSFADASGISAQNTATADDVFRILRYLYHYQSFILGVTKIPEKRVTTEDGNVFRFKNFNHFSGEATFAGGKTGYTRAAGETMASLFHVPVDGATTTIAIVVLGSTNRSAETLLLRDWFIKNVASDTDTGPFPHPSAFAASAAQALSSGKETVRIIPEVSLLGL